MIVSEDMETASEIKSKNLGIVTKDCASAVLEVYNNREKYKEQAKKAALFVRDTLSWKKYTEEMLKAYNYAWKKHK